ncbi:MAG TPA: peptidase S51 [Microbacterium sp.]|nr:peptidase S51 [Microbacterium sp.]
MSVHLVGGGWQDEPDGVAYASFVREATARATASGREIPRIAVIAVRDEDAAEHADRLVAAMRVAGDLEPVVTAVGETGTVPAGAFADVDAIVIGGGTTPAYRDVLEPHFDVIRDLVGAGIPYLGFSAGSVIAASAALVGGWRIGGVEVAGEDINEGLDEVTVRGGIGLVDVSVDVHVAQWGALSRIVAAAEAGLIDAGIGIDENTVLIAGSGPLQVAGTGSVWRVTTSERGIAVSTISSTISGGNA